MRTTAQLGSFSGRHPLSRAPYIETVRYTLRCTVIPGGYYLLPLDDNGPDLSAKACSPGRYHDSDIHKIGIQIRSVHSPELSLETVIRTLKRGHRVKKTEVFVLTLHGPGQVIPFTECAISMFPRLGPGTAPRMSMRFFSDFTSAMSRR